MDNYQKLVERIAKSANIEIEEIERKIEAKKAKLSGLISKEGAAQIVAAELGINFDHEKLKISEVLEGMKRANVTGKVIRLNPVREFNKNGREGKVASFTLADDSGNIRVALWDTNHIELIEKGEIKEGSVVEITSGNVRNGEIHLSSFGELKLSTEKMENVIEKQMTHEKSLKEVQPGQSIKTRAVIVGAFEPRYFEVNPETGRKFTEADKNNGLRPKKRALLNITIDDGTETIRSVAFGEQINQLGLKDEEIFSLEEFNKKKDDLLGEEKYFSGQIRTNSFSNTPELTIQGVEDVKPEELIKELESRN
ncbi:MAG: OB-fold nucleic acid binding domain-containing protein [archaeon]